MCTHAQVFSARAGDLKLGPLASQEMLLPTEPSLYLLAFNT